MKPLENPVKNINYLYELIKCKIYLLYLKVFYKKIKM